MVTRNRQICAGVLKIQNSEWRMENSEWRIRGAKRNNLSCFFDADFFKISMILRCLRQAKA